MTEILISQPKFTMRRFCSSISSEPILILHTIAILATFPTIQNLLITKVCLIYTQSNNLEVCDNLSNETQTKVEGLSSKWLLYTSLSYEGLAIFTSLFWGTLSDFYGRKCILMISSTFATICGLLNIWVATDLQLPLPYLLFSNIAFGLGGGFNLISSLTINYIHDVTSETDRTRRILFLSASSCIGGTLGPIISGVLIHYISYAAVFLLVTCLYVLSFFCAFFLLKDSSNGVIKKNNQGECKQSSNLLKNFIESLRKVRPGHQRMHIILLLISKSLFNLTLTGVLGRLLILYARDRPLQMSASNYNYFVGLIQFINGIGSIGGGIIITNVFKCHDLTLSIIGLTSGSIGYIVWGFGYYMWIMYIGAVLGMMCYLSAAGTQSMLSKILGKEEQGKIFAVSATMDYVTGTLSPLIFNFVYPASREFYNGLCFQLAAFFLLCAMLCLLIIKRDMKKQEQLGFYADVTKKLLN